MPGFAPARIFVFACLSLMAPTLAGAETGVETGAKTGAEIGAEIGAGGMDAAACRAFEESAQALASQASMRLELAPGKVADGFCQYGALSLIPEEAGVGRLGLRAEGLRIGGAALPWLMAVAEGRELPGALPTDLELAADGLRLAQFTGHVQTDYMLEVQSRAAAWDLALDLDWDQATRKLRLKSLDLASYFGDRLSLQAEVAQVDLSSKGAATMSLSGFAVTEVQAQLRLRGVVEQYLLPMLIFQVIPTDSHDAGADMAAFVAQAQGQIAALPDTSFDAESKAALSDMLGMLPQPWGDLDVKVTAEAGYGPLRFSRIALAGMPQNAAGVAPLLSGVTVKADWTPVTPGRPERD